MKILFLSPQLPFPLNVGSKIRIFNLLKIYSSKHDVDLLCFYKKAEKDISLLELSNISHNINMIPYESRFEFKQHKYKLIRLFYFFFSNFPFSVKAFYSLEFVDFLKTLDFNKYNIIHIEKLFLFPNLKIIFKTKRKGFKLIIDLDDYESRKIAKELKTLKISVKKTLLFIEYLKWCLLESKIGYFFDYCLTTSRIDKEYLIKKGNIKSSFILPNGIDLDTIKASSVIEKNNQILYFGSMSYYPNSDAVLYFLKEIFPKIKMVRPDTKFVIAGKEPLPEVKKLHNGKDIIVTGTVEDIKPIIQESTLVVVPLRFGGGTRIKILEAMSMKKAVVSTTVGCEGLELEAGKDIVIADNPAEFADACIDLLQNKQRKEVIENNGRKTVENKYDWNMIGESFLFFLQKINSNCIIEGK